MSDDRQVFTVIVEHGGNVALAGELDAAAVPDLKEALATRNGATTTLDVSGLTFIDSSGIHAIVEFARSREGDATVILTGASSHVLRVLEITRVTQYPRLRVDVRA